MQKPHCSAWWRRNASCSAESGPSGSASASTVSTCAALGLRGEQQARAHGAAVEAHGAGAADAVLAADVRAAQPERVAQEVGEQQAVVDVLVHAPAVDGDGELPHAATAMRVGALRRCGRRARRRDAAGTRRRRACRRSDRRPRAASATAPRARRARSACRRARARRRPAARAGRQPRPRRAAPRRRRRPRRAARTRARTRRSRRGAERPRRSPRPSPGRRPGSAPR